MVLVTLESAGALAHVEALADVHLGKPEAEIHNHTDHSVTREWGAAAIDAVDEARRTAHKAKAAAKPEEPSTPPSRTRRRGP